MTSLTGATAQKLPGTVEPPSFGLAMFGACMQLSCVLLTWSTQTSAADCLLHAPTRCVLDPRGADPWGRLALATVGGVGPATWLASLWLGRGEVTSDPSIVDRLWSILPMLYVGHLLLSVQDGPPQQSPRLVLMTALTCAWGLRLTYNFAIKGGFSGGEDYRWAEVRRISATPLPSRMHDIPGCVQVRKWFPAGWRFETFNLVFICMFQHVLILGFTTPAAVVFHEHQHGAASAVRSNPTAFSSSMRGPRTEGPCLLSVIASSSATRAEFPW
jgi:hypothetical protein